MAGNRARFEEALQKANDFVWAEKWQEAVAEYRRALQEFPGDTSPLMGYAWALLNVGETDAAAEVYEKLVKLSPKDPGPYERLAGIMERKGYNEKAGKFYFQAAELYRAQGLTDKQISVLESSVKDFPHNASAWTELLKYYQAQEKMERAVIATLWLAYLYQEEHPQWAIEVCRQMQSFAPQDRRLGQVMLLLQSGRPIPLPLGTGEFSQWAVEKAAEFEEEFLGDQGSPMEITRQRALESLAESIFAEESLQSHGLSQEEVSLLIGKAVDAQTRGDLQEAMDAYRRLVSAGVSMPSIHFNLGLLYKEQMHFDEAIEQFLHSVSDGEYLLGSHFALGECYQAQGDFQKASEHFIEAVKVIDLATVEREQADDLIRVYEGLAQSLVNAGEPERTQELSQSLVEFLSQRGWEAEVVQARRRLDGLARAGTVLSLAEILSLPGSEEILRSVALAQEHMRRKNPYSALEELEYSIGKAPLYMPLHSLLANLFMESDNLELALDKYRVIARSYEIREQIPQALATYRQILDLSPLDVAVHRRVIDLLVSHGKIDEALAQYLQLADAYYQLAQVDRAQDTYAEALRMAPRGSVDGHWEVRVLHRMADLNMQLLDWNTAVKNYEEITRIAPDDERAYLGLLRLYPRTGRVHLGMAALDRLIKRYLETRRLEKALAVLNDLVQDEPESIPLRYRLAQLYLNMGKREEALQNLDVLGDLQLEAGKQEDALKTMEAIIALNPPNVEEYKDLYRDMAGREPSENS
ncbi:MAG: tetratricopeptide repeat protein [Anaerolineae bacterium]|nr:tetratricopeptide repeat protein [Anaerolineae bacterium]